MGAFWGMIYLMLFKSKGGEEMIYLERKVAGQSPNRASTSDEDFAVQLEEIGYIRLTKKQVFCQRSEEGRQAEECQRLAAYLRRALSPKGFDAVMEYLDRNQVGTLRVDATANETTVWVRIYRERYPLVTDVELSEDGQEMIIKSLVRESTLAIEGERL